MDMNIQIPETKAADETRAVDDTIPLYNLAKPPRKNQRKNNWVTNYLKSAVWGALDGIITTYSVVMAADGAQLSHKIVIAIGLANMMGDGLSMSLGNYISTKAKREYYDRNKSQRKLYIQNNPKTESKKKLELIVKYQEKGIDQVDAIIIAETLTKHKDIWLDTILIDQMGLLYQNSNPIIDSITTLVAFNLFGIIPIIPYIFGIVSNNTAFMLEASTIITIIGMFLIGAAKSQFTHKKWYSSGFETLCIGAIAAAASYGIGLMFAKIE